MLAIALGLASALSWGAADFIAGIKTRRLPLLVVLVVSQATGLLAVAAVVALSGEPAPATGPLLASAGAGVAGVVGLGALYRGLSVGTMSIVSPISGTSAVVPVLVGVATGERPSGLQVAGIVAALAGVALASRQADDAPGGEAVSGVGYALIAALGLGVWLVGIDSAADESVFWALLLARGSGVGALLAVYALRRPAGAPRAADLPALVAIGALDVGSNALFAWGSTTGLVSVVAVLASLYPVATVLLARAILGERLQTVQAAGVVAALAGVALLAAG